VRRFAATDEAFHEPGPDEQWSDSLYFGGADGSPRPGDERATAFYTRIGWRANEGRIEGALGAWLPDGRFALAFARLKAADHELPDIACGPVRYECDAPFERWRVRIAGTARLYERAEDVALARDRFEEVALSGELRFEAWTDPIAFDSGLTESVAAIHYEQPGSVDGVLEVAGIGHAIAGRGLRDHSWGVRDWQAVPYWRWFGMVVDRDTFLLLNNVGAPDGTEVAGGCLMRDGLLAPIVTCQTDSELDPELGCQRRFSARARDAQGRETLLEGEAVSVAPLRQRRDGRLTNVNEGLTHLRWEGHEGYGISEYLVQHAEAAGRA
jgi:hypothetical protein